MTEPRDLAHHSVFVTGGTGYVGRALVPALAARGHAGRALTRPASLGRVPAGCTAVAGDALDHATYAHRVRAGDTVVHLVGTPHPNPRKAPEFERIDLGSVRGGAAAERWCAGDGCRGDSKRRESGVGARLPTPDSR